MSIKFVDLRVRSRPVGVGSGLEIPYQAADECKGFGLVGRILEVRRHG
jgi:hypothetical protein